MHETAFHPLADLVLQRCFAGLEAAYDSGALEDLELQNGILTLVTASGKTLVLSKHAPTCQLWLASPISGGLHFVYDASTERWVTRGEELYSLLTRELASQHIMVTL